MLLKSLDWKSLRNSPLGCTEQLTYIKSIDMLNKNTQGAKKARPSLKHQLAFIRACAGLKSLISGGGQGPTELFVSKNVRSITYKFQKIQSLTLDVQQFEHN